MFGNSTNGKTDSKGKTTSTTSAGGHSLNSINQGTTVEGTIKAQSDIRIDGNIKGTLLSDAKVIIGPTGKVEGEVRCENAVIEGSFEGTLTVRELLNIRETAVIDGDVTTSKLIVQPGGVLNGTCHMKGSSVSNGTVMSDDKSANRANNAKSAKVTA